MLADRYLAQLPPPEIESLVRCEWTEPEERGYVICHSPAVAFVLDLVEPGVTSSLAVCVDHATGEVLSLFAGYETDDRGRREERWVIPGRAA